MKVENNVKFVIEKEERRYVLEMPVGAPLAEAYGSVGEFLDHMVKLINNHSEKIHNDEIKGEKEEEKE